MWTSVYMTQDIDTARIVRSRIEERTIPVMLHRICSDDNANGNDCYELLVPQAELCEALEIIIGE